MRRLVQLTALAYVFFLFFWFGIEDRSLAYPAALGAGGALLLAAYWAQGLWRKAHSLHLPGAPAAESRPRFIQWLLRLGAIGLLAGAVAPALTVALLVVKVSLHVHPTPDFTLAEVMGVLWRAPLWAGAGLLAALGLGLLRLGLYNRD